MDSVSDLPGEKVQWMGYYEEEPDDDEEQYDDGDDGEYEVFLEDEE